MTDKEKIDELLTRGVGEFFDSDGSFRKKLETSPEQVVIKFGVDPTRPDIHLGHAVVLRKLRQFQDLGCKVIFLAGDFTGMIGDPTGKSKVRPEMSQEQASINMQTFVKQIPKILKIEPTSEEEKDKKIIKDSTGFVVESPWFSWMRNSDWFFNVTDITSFGASEDALTIKDEKGQPVKDENGQPLKLEPNSFPIKAAVFENTRMQKLIGKDKVHSVSLVTFLGYLRLISHSQLIERDMFKKRIKKNEPLFMHEMLYPVVQGIDSNLIHDIYGTCDLEVGGTDQTFNMLVGRSLMKSTKREPSQAVLSFKILEGLDGKEKMSKSLDNYIGITEEPKFMYGKVMSIPDSLIGNYFELCTDAPIKEVEEIRKAVKSGSVNPRDIKMKLAKEIVKIYHGEQEAIKAEESFSNTFQNKEIPDGVEEVENKGRSIDVILSSGGAKSLSAARILLDAGAVTDMTDDKKITQEDKLISGHVYKIGKHKFIKVK